MGKGIKKLISLVLVFMFVLSFGTPVMADEDVNLGGGPNEQYISGIDIWTVVPAAGARNKDTDEQRLYYNEPGFQVVYTGWFTDTWQEPYYFVEGNTYYLKVVLEAEEGYFFSADTHITVNNADVLILAASPDEISFVTSLFTVEDRWPFYDIQEDEVGANAAKHMYNERIISGMGEDPETGLIIFKPGKNVTRAQFCIMLYKMATEAGHISSGEAEYYRSMAVAGFSDINYSSSGYAAIAWAKEKGIISGYGDGTFKPDKPIKRAHLCSMIMKYAYKYDTNETTSQPVLNDPKILAAYSNQYKDFGTVDGAFIEAVMWASQWGIISGKSKGGNTYIDPKGNATRLQCTMFLYRYFEYTVPKG